MTPCATGRWTGAGPKNWVDSDACQMGRILCVLAIISCLQKSGALKLTTGHQRPMGNGRLVQIRCVLW